MQTDVGAAAPPENPGSPMSPPTSPPASPPTTAPTEDLQPASTTFLIVVSFISCAADLITKGWAKHRLAGADPQKFGAKKIEVIKDHLDFIYALNPGGAWSFLRSLPDSLRRPFFLFVSASAIVFIVSIYRRVPQSHTAMRWGLPLALGGAMGNLVDRIRYGQVIDFIDMYFTRGGRETHWPTYNVADIAIVAGVALMVIDMILPARRPAPPSDDAGPTVLAPVLATPEAVIAAPLDAAPSDAAPHPEGPEGPKPGAPPAPTQLT
jgi:signal peptidase II